MVGITSYGAYIPLHRLDRAELFRAWGGTLGMSVPGEKAVASFDEDSVTMAVEAVIDCINGIDSKAIDGLFFASTTHPYNEKQSSAIVSAVIDMDRKARIVDFGGSLRTGAIAINSALDAINAGSAKNIMVTASDTRLGAPAGFMEQGFGDGAAAFLLGKENVIAAIEDNDSISDEFSGIWRADTDTFVRAWEDRMVNMEGYSVMLSEVMKGVMNKCGLKPGDFAKAVYCAPIDVRQHARLGRTLGFDPEQVQDPMFLTMGNTGAAFAMMLLVAALEEAKPGDRILYASYGNGADAFVLQVTEAIEKARDRRGMKKHLESKRMLTNYERYLRWRGLVPLEASQRADRGPTSISALYRARKGTLALYGVKCRKCGTPQYGSPMMSGGRGVSKVCVICQAKDEFDDYKFADKKGVVFNFSHDHIVASPDPPTTQAIIDFEGGGRGMFDMTDREPDNVEVGMPVEMTFRKLFFDRGIHNYYWKARPIRV
jgi:3-hydroxy-3-methylglutaryl CoA synthase